MIIDNRFGQSGSNVSLIAVAGENQEVLVKKISSEARFVRQFNKHVEAEKHSRMFPIKVPEIRENFSNNSYSMKYILSENLGESISKYKSSFPQEIILAYLNKSFGGEIMSLNKKEVLIDYFEKKLKINYDLGHINRLKHKSILNRFADHLTLSKVTEGWNHGDFSFENILVSRDGRDVYVIDFLDSPIDTPLIDLGRIYLDLSLGWWNSHKKINELNSQIVIFKTKIENLVLEKELDLEILRLFAFFACVRVMPYTKNPIRIGFLKSYCHEMMKS
jgi:serine/threonine protein kinase